MRYHPRTRECVSQLLLNNMGVPAKCVAAKQAHPARWFLFVIRVVKENQERSQLWAAWRSSCSDSVSIRVRAFLHLRRINLCCQVHVASPTVRGRACIPPCTLKTSFRAAEKPASLQRRNILKAIVMSSFAFLALVSNCFNLSLSASFSSTLMRAFSDQPVSSPRRALHCSLLLHNHVLHVRCVRDGSLHPTAVAHVPCVSCFASPSTVSPLRLHLDFSVHPAAIQLCFVCRNLRDWKAPASMKMLRMVTDVVCVQTT